MSATAERSPIDTIVLLPGMDGTGDLFAPLVPTLQAWLQVRIIDYPPDPGLGYRELETYVRARLPNGGRFALLGESFSGPIAISIAADPPPNMAACVLCCTFARNPRPQLAALRALLFAVSPALAPAWVTNSLLLGDHADARLRAALGDVLRKVPSNVIQARLREVLDVDVADHLSKVRLPVLYLQATADRLIPESVGFALQRTNDAMRVERIDGPHFLLQTQPQAASVAIMTFLQSA